MKREAFGKIKFDRLAERLQIDLAFVHGICDCLWGFTGIHYPDGNIAALRPRELARKIGVTSIEPDALIQALKDEHFLDDLPDGVLYIHDWHEHADDFVHLKLARKGEIFANGALPNTSRLSVAERTKLPSVRTASARRAHGVPTACSPPGSGSGKGKGSDSLERYVGIRKSSSSSSSSAQNGKKTTTTMTTTIGFAKELLRTHPKAPECSVAGNVKLAAEALDEIGFTDELAARMRAAHEQYVEHWKATQPDYIPNLERWIEGGDWERPPKKQVDRITQLALEIEADREKKKKAKAAQ